MRIISKLFPLGFVWTNECNLSVCRKWDTFKVITIYELSINIRFSTFYQIFQYFCENLMFFRLSCRFFQISTICIHFNQNLLNSKSSSLVNIILLQLTLIKFQSISCQYWQLCDQIHDTLILLIFYNFIICHHHSYSSDYYSDSDYHQRNVIIQILATQILPVSDPMLIQCHIVGLLLQTTFIQ